MSSHFHVINLRSRVPTCLFFHSLHQISSTEVKVSERHDKSMEGFITRKRSLAELDTNAGRLPSPAPSSSLVQPSSRPAKKTKTVSRVADSTSRTKRTNKASAKSKVVQTPGHCSLNKKEFGDRIKNCLALEKYAVQRMSFQVNTCSYIAPVNARGIY
jgi:hypothetical protein